MKSSIITLALALFLVLPATLSAQTTLPYFTGFDNAAQKNGWQQFRKGDAGMYQWQYGSAAPYSGTDCLYHGYPVGGTVVTDDWFVSPAFSLPAGGSLDSLRFSFSGMGVPGPGDTIAVYLLTGNADPALAAHTLLYDFRGAQYPNDMEWHLMPSASLPASSAPVYIAFRLHTVSNWLTAKFDNIALSGKAVTGVHTPGQRPSPVKIYPNPAGTVLYIEGGQKIKEVRITDAGGRTMYHQAYDNNPIDLSGRGSGVYTLSCLMDDGTYSHCSFIKQ